MSSCCLSTYCKIGISSTSAKLAATMGAYIHGVLINIPVVYSCVGTNMLLALRLLFMLISVPCL